jgi:rod shape-determining protein MreD
MTYVVALAVAWLLAIIQASALPHLHVLGVTPDFVLIFAACFAVLRRQEEAMYVVPLAGLMRDFAMSDPIGTSVLGFAPIVLLAAGLRLRAMDSQFVPAVAVVAAGTICYIAISVTVLLITGQGVDPTHGIIRIVLPLAVVNSLFTPIIYMPMSWFRQPDRSPVLGSGRLTSPL